MSWCRIGRVQMDPQTVGQMTLHNDSVINVAALLQEQTGSTRSYRVVLDRFNLDEDLVAKSIVGAVRLTRLSDAILTTVRGSTSVTLTCQRCLNEFDLALDVFLDEQFRIAYDVRRGTEIESDLEGIDERPELSENHELDFGESLRQEIILELPMRPVCGPDCPGPPKFVNEDVVDVSDPFAALAALLETDE